MSVFHRIVLPAMALGLMAGCMEQPLPVPGLGTPDIIQIQASPPPGSPEGACWGREVTPAVLETVTEQVMLQPAQVRADGTVEAPAVYITETKQAIVKERRELWFRTPCQDELTPDFIASLQRALTVRGDYGGPISGRMDRITRRAVHRYQAPLGLDSGILSLAAARKLGLSVVEEPVDPTAPGAVPENAG